MNMFKKYWWIVAVVVIAVIYVIYRGTQGVVSYGTVPTESALPVVQSSSSPSNSNNIYTVRTDPTKGNYLADFQGMTLYTYDKDTPGVSNCTGACLAAWPVYSSGATAETQLPENVTVITDANGTMQFAWKGMPLYYYAKDQNPGDILGDGVGGIWHLVKP